jgi:hypothetical protein
VHPNTQIPAAEAEEDPIMTLPKKKGVPITAWIPEDVYEELCKKEVEMNLMTTDTAVTLALRTWFLVMDVGQYVREVTPKERKR